MKILSANQKLNPFIAANLDVLSGIAEIQGLDERAREFNNFARAAERLADAQARLRDIPTIEFTPPDPTPDPGDIPLDPALQKLLDELQSGNGNQNGNGNGEEEVKVKIELDENASEFFTATREKALQQGFDLQ